MKRILGLAIAALLIIGIVGGGTWAYFSDTETSLGNTWTAGTLNLVDVISGTAVNSSISINAGAGDAADGINDKIEFGLTDPVKPGSSGTITWTLSNTGNVSGNLTMVAATTFGENGSNEPEAAVAGNNGGGNGDLDQYLVVWVTRGGTDILGTTAAYVPMSGLAAALNLENRSLAGGGSLVYVLNWQIPADIPAVDDNIIQSDTAQLDITFTLTQS